MKSRLWILALLFVYAPLTLAGKEGLIIIYGEYPVVQELRGGRFEERGIAEGSYLIDYAGGEGYKEKAFAEAFHFLNANVFGYTFFYKPGSILMKTEEIFELGLRGNIGKEDVSLVGEGVSKNIYRVKLGFQITPSVSRWQSAFHSNTIRLTESEGTSDFYTGWEGRSDALYEALRNLVLTAAKKELSSKPLLLRGDILLQNNPEFSVGAGRHYCKVQGFVNFVEVVTYD